MSGERGSMRGWLLPVIVVAVGAYFLVSAAQRGALNAVSLKPAGWVGLGLMAAGIVPAVGKKPLWKLAGVLVCGIGALMVFIG